MGILDSLKKGFDEETEGSGEGSTLADMVRSSSSPDSGRARVIVVEPMKMEECNALVECIRHGLIVIINCDKTEPALARRIVDFLTGATRAIDGRTLKINATTHIFAPADIDIATRRKKPAQQPEAAPEAAASEAPEEGSAEAPDDLIVEEKLREVSPEQRREYHDSTIIRDSDER
jgi:FtsZ-interacting cell division protein YlmF